MSIPATDVGIDEDKMWLALFDVWTLGEPLPRLTWVSTVPGLSAVCTVVD
jgi:hypothetical protein